MTEGNNGTGNNVSRDDWQTPNTMWNKLNEQYKFTLDCCASKDNAKCLKFFTNFEEEKRFVNSIDTLWINPPFSKSKEMIKTFLRVANRGVGIYRIDNIETEVWNFILNNADWVHIIKGRTNYVGHEGHGARFGSALFGVGVLPPKDIDGVTVKKFVQC